MRQNKKNQIEALWGVFFFSLKKLVRLFNILKEVKHSPDGKIIKLVTFHYYFSHYDIFAKTRGRMTTAITLSRQNDAGSRVSNTQKVSIKVARLDFFRGVPPKFEP